MTIAHGFLQIFSFFSLRLVTKIIHKNVYVTLHSCATKSEFLVISVFPEMCQFQFSYPTMRSKSTSDKSQYILKAFVNVRNDRCTSRPNFLRGVFDISSSFTRPRWREIIDRRRKWQVYVGRAFLFTAPGRVTRRKPRAR